MADAPVSPIEDFSVTAAGFRSTREPKKGLIRGEHLETREVRFSDLDGVAIFEGDIDLGPTALLIQSVERGAPLDLAAKGAAITGEAYRWPSGVIPYQIHKKFPDADRVREAIRHWEARTPIRFVERTSANATQHPNYVHFKDEGHCRSAVGMQGGEQVVSLGSQCTLGNAIHEIGHVVGLWHEQSREDRDEHVEVRLSNVIDGYHHNFDQHITDGDDIGAYDYVSIMHYPKDAFSKNGQDTIVARKGEEIGQRKGLSATDIATVKELYRKQTS
jgi:hypothetical protein